MGAFYNEGSIDGDLYVLKLSTYIKRNEESLANGLLMFSKNKSSSSKVKPSRLTISLHHLYYLLEKIDGSGLGVDIGPLNIRLESPNHEPTFISFMANNARSSKHFDSDAKSISSISSVRSIVSNASVYWRNLKGGNASKDPKVIGKDLKYLYSSFTKVPCLILSPKTKINTIVGYEEYPCDTSVPIRMFKNLQVLEIVDYDPNEIFGWNILSEQLRILVIKSSKINDVSEVLINLVLEDEFGRSAFNTKSMRRSNTNHDVNDDADNSFSHSNNAFKYPNRQRAQTTTTESPELKETLGDTKWALLKQLSIVDTSVTSIPAFVFKPLYNIVKLNLSNNLLGSIPEGLDQLVNIKYINFSDNYITNLKNLPGNLKHLTTLNFNNNKIVSLEGLERLCSLEKVDFRRNNLSAIKSFKPILYLFIKINDKFNNVYLNHNNLPKSFRIDLFNLVNGIKYKNNFRLDDSRPGYFENALLLDNEAAIRNLHTFFKTNSVSRDSMELITSLSSLDLEDETKPFSALTNNQNVVNVSDLNKLKKSTTLSNISDQKNTATSMVSQVQVTARMST